MKTLKQFENMLDMSSEDVSEDVSPILEKGRYRYILDEAWEEDNYILFELSGDFKMVYEFLEMDGWSPELNGVRPDEKVYLNIIRDGETFQIDSIRVGNNVDDGNWGLIRGNIDIDYPLDIINVNPQDIPEDEIFTCEFEFERLALLFHDQEWWWTRDAEKITHTISGHLDTPELGVESDIWVHSVDSLNMDHGYIHGDPYRGMITM